MAMSLLALSAVTRCKHTPGLFRACSGRAFCFSPACPLTSRGSTRVGRSPGARAAAETLPLLPQRCGEKVSAFRLSGRSALPGFAFPERFLITRLLCVGQRGSCERNSRLCRILPLQSVAQARVRKPSQ